MDEKTVAPEEFVNYGLQMLLNTHGSEEEPPPVSTASDSGRLKFRRNFDKALGSFRTREDLSTPMVGPPSRALIGVYYHYTGFMAAFRALEVVAERNGLSQTILGQELVLKFEDDIPRYHSYFEDLARHDSQFLIDWRAAYGKLPPGKLRGDTTFMSTLLADLAQVNPEFRRFAGVRPNLGRVTQLTSQTLQRRQTAVARMAGLRPDSGLDPSGDVRTTEDLRNAASDPRSAELSVRDHTSAVLRDKQEPVAGGFEEAAREALLRENRKVNRRIDGPAEPFDS